MNTPQHLSVPWLAFAMDEEGAEYPELALIIAVVVVAAMIGLAPLLNTRAGAWVVHWWNCLVAASCR